MTFGNVSEILRYIVVL